MTDELRKDEPAISPARVPGTREIVSRDNDVIAGDDDLAQRKTGNVRVPGDTKQTAHRPAASTEGTSEEEE